MRAVSYLTRRSANSRGALAFMGGSLLSRARWSELAEFPLVRWVTLHHPDLPRGIDGLRLVQVSDVHAGNFMPTARLEQVRDAVTALRPDVIAFTGDQLDRRDVDSELFVHGFAGIWAPLGTFGVLGNHDHVAGPELAIAALEAAGITPLVNQAALVERGGDRLLLAGVDDLDASPGWGADFSVLQTREVPFKMLLCHQPNGWLQGRLAGAQITLSGHTHGGQIAFPTRGLNIARLGTRFVAGAYAADERLLFVSRGVGVGAIPVRYGAPPEIDVITLRRGPVAARIR